MSTTFSRLTASITAAKGMAKSHCRQRKDTISADRAEAPLDPKLRQDHEYSRMLQATHGNEMEDGAFACCCGAENVLVHYRGSHPFRKLRCGRCDHIFCSKCSSTEILTPLPGFQVPVGAVKLSTASHFGQICSSCGLTHRATRKLDGSVSLPSTCSCGANSNEEWLRFGIGSPDRYRYDPNAAYVQMKVRRAVKTIGRLTRDVEKPIQMIDRLRQDSMKPEAQVLTSIAPINDECDLKRRNAVRYRKLS